MRFKRSILSLSVFTVLILVCTSSFAEPTLSASELNVCLSPVKDPDASITACTRVIVSDPSKGKEVLAYRGLAYILKHDSDKALLDFNQFLKYFPQNSGTLINRARAKAEKGQYDSAIEDLKSSLSFSDTEENAAAAYAGLGMPYLAKGDFKSAIAALTQAIIKMPDNAGLFYQRGIANYYGGHTNLAISDLEKAMTLDPANPYKRIWLHLAYLKDGQGSSKELQIDGFEFINDKWPAPILALYKKQTLESEVFIKARSSNPTIRREQICEASFYVGAIWALNKNLKDEAIRELEYASENCPKYFIEQATAQAELKLLSPLSSTTTQ